MISTCEMKEKERFRLIGNRALKEAFVEVFPNKVDEHGKVKTNIIMKALVRYYVDKDIVPEQLKPIKTEITDPTSPDYFDSVNNRSIVHLDYSPDEADELKKYLLIHKLQKKDFAQRVMRKYVSQGKIHPSIYRIECFRNPDDYSDMIILRETNKNHEMLDIFVLPNGVFNHRFY